MKTFRGAQVSEGCLPSELKPVAMCHWLTRLCPPSPASEDGSESEGSESSGRSCPNEHSIQEKLQVLMAEGLLPAVKIFLDWLRTNPDLIVVCAQVLLQPHRPSPGPGVSARLGQESVQHLLAGLLGSLQGDA